MQSKLNLTQVQGLFAVVQLGADEPIPSWALAPSGFSAIVRTQRELSIVVPEVLVPPNSNFQGGFACLRIEGPFPFSAIGVLASVADPLAEASVSIFVVSTFDTDYILVPHDQLASAKAALSGSGHSVYLL